ncbi:MAG: hypothetical protein ACT4PT_04695 [Methanobacteriota archaeon]
MDQRLYWIALALAFSAVALPATIGSLDIPSVAPGAEATRVRCGGATIVQGPGTPVGDVDVCPELLVR